MFRSIIFISSITFAAGALSSRAEVFTLESAVAQSLKGNPDLAAARLSISEAKGRLLQSGRLANPELEGEWKPNVRAREVSFGMGFVQRFPLSNRLRLEKLITQAEVSAAEAEVKFAETKVATAVRLLGVKLLCLEESRRLKEKQIANSNALARAAADLAKKAEGPESAAAQFELEAQQLLLELLQLEAEKASLLGELRPLLGLEPEQTISIGGTLPDVVLPVSAEVDLARRADYQAAQARVEAAKQGVGVAEANKWADADFGLTAEYSRLDDAGLGLEKETTVGLKFSLPLPWWNKNEGAIKAAEAAVQRSQKEAAAVALHGRTEAAAALSEMRTASRIHTQTTEILLPKASEIEESLNRFYKQAQPGAQLSDVLRAREKRLGLEQACLDALRSFHLARIRFEAARGH
jgi:cobalt-zinc-cadmium efflux system outer membrane protein